MKKTLLLAASALLATSMLAETRTFNLSVASFAEFQEKWVVEGDDDNATKEEMSGDKFKCVHIGFGAEGFAALNDSPVSLEAVKKNTAQFKLYTDYLQPNGTGRILVIATEVGDKVTVQLKDAYADLSDITVEGADALSGAVDAGATFDMIATAEEVRLTNTGAKPKYQSVTIETTGGEEPGTFVDNPIAEQIFFNGSAIMNGQGLSLSVYNTLGKLVLTTSDASVNMNDMAKGIYIVRAEGVKGALKISL